jgi:hypothetical protein
MDVKSLLDAVASGGLTPDEALTKLQLSPYQELFHGLSLDTHRQLRTGLGEVVFAPGKSDPQLLQAVSGLAETAQPVLVTRASNAQARLLEEGFPEGKAWPEAGLFSLGGNIDLSPPWKSHGEVIIVTAGSSDLPVALEALGAGQFFGLEPGLISDVGVAGLHRITPKLSSLQKAKMLIVVAGMEGALPSVLAGMLGRPTLAVPTSVGYGVSQGGQAALMGMLSSCAPGIAVVNIDNGFGAAVMAVKCLQSFQSET